MNLKSDMIRFCRSPRTAGTASNRKIRDLILQRCKSLGYLVEQQNHPFEGWQLAKPPKVTFLSPVRHTAKCTPVVRSGSTGGKAWKGRIKTFFKAIKTFEAYDFQKFTIVDDDGNDIGVLMTRPDMVWPQPLDEVGQHLPHIIVDTKTCALINQWMADNREIRVSFSVATRRMRHSQITNVVAEKPEGTSGLILSTHYDSFFNTVGAHDNASGAVSLLSIAERLRFQERVKPTICFFDAEEWNKYGAYCYVERCLQEGVLENIRLQINIDSVGVPDHLYMLTSPEIERTTSDVVRAVSDGKDLQVEVSSQTEFPQFDTWPFMRAGASVIQVGSRSDPPFRKWHSPADDLQNIDYDFMARVVEFMESFIVAVNDTEIPRGKQ